jgi:exopolysaccharide production protein ExoZ
MLGSSLAKPVSSKIIVNVTILRLISTYILVIYHGRPSLLDAGINEETVHSLRVGTDLFLVCSAFLTIHTTFDKQITGSTFLLKRLARIVPLYWFVTFLIFGLAALAPTLFQATRADPSELIKSLLFIPYEKRNHAIQPMVFVAWTLNYIVLFSVVHAVSIAIAGARRAWILTSVMICGLMLMGQIATSDQPAFKFYTSPILSDFLYGMWLCQLFNYVKIDPRNQHDRAPKLIILAFGCAVACMLIVLQPYGWPSVHRCISFGIPCAALMGFAVAAEALGFRIEGRVSRALSKFTFSIYLSHFFATGLLAVYTARYSPLSIEELTVGLSATLVGATVLGGLLYFLVEAPLNRIVRKKGARVLAALGRQRASLQARRPVTPHVVGGSQRAAFAIPGAGERAANDPDSLPPAVCSRRP